MGFIDLDQVNMENVTYFRNNKKIFSFLYDGKKYFFKEAKHVEQIYNELIAALIAKQYGINCALYDLAVSYGQVGVISESFLEEKDEYLSMEAILKNYFKESKVNNHNNLEDIWLALDYYFAHDDKIVDRIMEQVLDTFLFDVLIGNIDRHGENMGVIKRKNQYFLAPLFDNELMLEDSCIYEGIYVLGIDSSDYFQYMKGYSYSETVNFLDKFLSFAGNSYLDKIQSKISLISEENIKNIFAKIEVRLNIKINVFIRNKILDKFNINKKMILDTLQRHTRLKLIKKVKYVDVN